MSFDLNSLYPHLIMQFNISPEKMIKGGLMDTKIEKMLHQQNDLSQLKKENVTVTPNGVKFKRDKQGFLPELMETLYDERREYKQKMIAHQKELQVCDDPIERKRLEVKIKRAYNNQQVRKISLNSAYGVLANQYFAFFDPQLAESVTTAGQLLSLIHI